MPSCLSLGCFCSSERTLHFPGTPSACFLKNRLWVTPYSDVFVNNHFIEIKFTCHAVHPFRGLLAYSQSCAAITAAYFQNTCITPERNPTALSGHCSFLPTPRSLVATNLSASTYAYSGRFITDGIGQCVSFGVWLLTPTLY